MAERVGPLPNFTTEQQAIIHIFADYFAGHAAWHSVHGYVGCDHACPYCETLNNMELYIQSRVERSKR